jgi:hypothetical protein
MKLNINNRFSFEALLIVLSVLLGFGVSEWRQASADDALAERVRANLLTEVEYNLAQMETVLPQHERLLTMVANADLSDSQKSGWDVLIAQITQAGGGLVPPSLRQGAWDAAVSTGALRLLDYELVAELSGIYNLQDVVDSRFTTMAIGYEPDTFRPGMQSETVQAYRWMAQEVVNTESELRDLYVAYLEGQPRTTPAQVGTDP